MAADPTPPAMAVKAVVFDIGGVLEVTPPTGMTGKWEHELGLDHGELAKRLTEVTEAGAIGAISEERVHVRVERWDYGRYPAGYCRYPARNRPIRPMAASRSSTRGRVRIRK